jgi:hypothetical protein
VPLDALAAAAATAGAAGATPPAALSVAVVGVAPGPFSATVRWQVSAPASVVVEYGPTDDTEK